MNTFLDSSDFLSREAMQRDPRKASTPQSATSPQSSSFFALRASQSSRYICLVLICCIQCIYMYVCVCMYLMPGGTMSTDLLNLRTTSQIGPVLSLSSLTLVMPCRTPSSAHVLPDLVLVVGI